MKPKKEANDLQHIHITADHYLFDMKLKEVWKNRQLIWLFTKRSFVVTYKQTILGPLWLFIMPLLTSLTYVFLFGHVANLSTDGTPQLLFYFTGNSLWLYFSTCVAKCANTFLENQGLYGKVYFPRLVVPLSDVLSSLMKFGIQMIIVALLLAIYTVRGDVRPNFGLFFLLPLILLFLGIMGMGFGLIISSFTTRYRDLYVLVTFGLTIWMYASPVIYPMSSMTRSRFWNILLINPVTEPFELFRYVLLGKGTFSMGAIAISAGIALLVILIGIVSFNHVERTFTDTI